MLDEKKKNSVHLKTIGYARYQSEQGLLQLLGHRNLLTRVRLHIPTLVVRLESEWNRE